MPSLSNNVEKKFNSGEVLTAEESLQLLNWQQYVISGLELRRPVLEAFYDFKERHGISLCCPKCGEDDVKSSTTTGNCEFWIGCRDPDCGHTDSGQDFQAFEICEKWIKNLVFKTQEDRLYELPEIRDMAVAAYKSGYETRQKELDYDPMASDAVCAIEEKWAEG